MAHETPTPRSKHLSTSSSLRSCLPDGRKAAPTFTASEVCLIRNCPETERAPAQSIWSAASNEEPGQYTENSFKTVRRLPRRFPGKPTFRQSAAVRNASSYPQILPTRPFSQPRSLYSAGFWRNGCRAVLDLFYHSSDVELDQPASGQCSSRSQPLTVSWTGGDSGQVIALLGLGEEPAHRFERSFRLHCAARFLQLYHPHRYAGELARHSCESVAIPRMSFTFSGSPAPA
jgi:hypothetical protein